VLDATRVPTDGQSDTVEGAALPIIIITCVLVGGVWLAKDVPAILQELRHSVEEWAAVHEVTRQVDCRPWGLDKRFTILQDHATTSPAKEATCSWATVPGRKWEFGHTLWNGALVMTKSLIERRHVLAKGMFSEGRSVLELGCGQPLVSMVLLELFAGLGKIVATDGSEEVLLAAEANVTANCGPERNPKFVLAPLFWGRQHDISQVRALNGNNNFDVILGSDVTYAEEFDELVDTIVELSHAETEVWITHEPRQRSVEPLLARLRREFGIVEERELRLAKEETASGATDRKDVTILSWHCTGKVSR